MKVRIDDLRQQLTEIQDGRPWIGTNFSKKLSFVSDDDFFKRPAEKMHSIAEIIGHLSTWRKETAIKLVTGRGTLTDDHPSNWRSLKELKSLGREKLMEEFFTSLSEILTQLEGQNDDFLESSYYDGDFKCDQTYGWLLYGMLQHDAYHLGQIGYVAQLLKNRQGI